MPVKKCLVQTDVTKAKQAVKTYPPATADKQVAAERKIVKEQKDVQARSSMSADKDYYRIGGDWYLKGKKVTGSALEKIKKMAIPPAWENALVSIDSKAKILATGVDNAGRWQPRYSVEHNKQKDIIKFDRQKLFSRDLASIRKNNGDKILKEDVNAMLLKLEDKTAIRIGSKAQYKTKKEAYGLTTLKNEHVKVQGDKIFLSFTAKEGLPAHYEVKDKVLADWLVKRKEKFKDFLFSDTSDDKLNKYLQKMAGGKKYTIKDFRTHHATRIAFTELKKYETKALSPKEKKVIVKDVLDKVSKFLHNSPSMTKKSYINPMVWQLIGGI